MEVDQFKYYDKDTPINSIILGSVLKYSGLLVGMYPAFSTGEVDGLLAAAGGSVYVLGEILVRKGEQANNIHKFSKLEESLKESSW